MTDAVRQMAEALTDVRIDTVEVLEEFGIGTPTNDHIHSDACYAPGPGDTEVLICDLGAHPDCPLCGGTGEAPNAQFKCGCRWAGSATRAFAEKATLNGHRRPTRVCARAAALLEQQATWEQWQPIETAPKDGTPVLLFVPSSGECVVAACFSNTWYSTYWQDEFLGDPSHWMPLPAPPPPTRSPTSGSSGRWREGKGRCGLAGGRTLMMRKCEECDGSGKTKCFTCGGTGEIPTSCNYCTHSHQCLCLGCEGTGKEECLNCNGAGWIRVEENE